MSARSRWLSLLWIIPVAIVVLVLVVLAARGIRELPSVRSFMLEFPGTSALPNWAPIGFPAWVGWQHGLNAFFLLFIIRTGWLIRTTGRPSTFWTRNNTGRIRTKNPPIRVGLQVWFHLVVDTLWVINGVVFYALIFSTGQWVRIVPTNWDALPNAVSAGIQYASLDWPLANGWVNYNALQTLSYFLVVFVAAPIALITGLRISPGLAVRLRRFDRVYPLRWAKAVHFAVMVFFAAFIVVHVTLVLSTGALHNLNHMYASRNDASWVGFWIFAASIVVMIVAWFAATPTVLKAMASRSGTIRG